MFPHGKTVTLVSTVTARDDYGDSTSTVSETVVPDCAVAPRFATESTDPRVAPVMVGLTVYMPAGTAIDADDVLRIDGKLWQVDGLPAAWENPFTGWAPGLEVPVKRASDGS